MPAALTAAFVWGVLSILLSPCHLASIPLIVGFVSGQSEAGTKRAFRLSLLFALGILVTIALIGIVTGLLGRLLGDLGGGGDYLVAAVLLLTGLYLLGCFPLSFSGSTRALENAGRGSWAALILGFVFGIALGPCTFAYMAPMLAVAFRLASTNLIYGLGLLFLYGLGHCSVIVAAGTSTALVQRYLNWDRNSRATVYLKKICGLLLLLAAAGLFLRGR